MNIVLPILLVLEVVSSFLLISVILLQKSKGGGLSGSAFGGGGGDSMFGARAGNVLTKITIILATFFMLDTMLIALHFAGQDEKDPSVMERGSGGEFEIRDVDLEAPAPQDGSNLDSVPIDTLPLDFPGTEASPLPAGDAVVVPPAVEIDAPPAVPDESVTDPAE